MDEDTRVGVIAVCVVGGIAAVVGFVVLLYHMWPDWKTSLMIVAMVPLAIAGIYAKHAPGLTARIAARATGRYFRLATRCWKCGKNLEK